MSDNPRGSESPPEQSPLEEISEILEVSGEKASQNSIILGWYTRADDGALLDVISGLRHMGPAEIEDLLSMPVPDFAAGVHINEVDEAVFRRVSEGERGKNGNLIWLRANGERR